MLRRLAYEKPRDARVWRPAAVPMPSAAYLMLPGEWGGAVLREWRRGAVSNAWSGATWAREGVEFAAASSQYLTFARDTALEAGLPYSFAIRYRPTTIGANQGIFATSYDGTNYAGVWMSVNGTGTVGVNYGDNGPTDATHRRSITTTGTLSAGSWYTIHAVVTGATAFSVYFNNVLQAGTTSGTGGALTWIAGTLNFGRLYAGSNIYANGNIGWAMLWPGVALTSADVQAHYADPFVWLPAGPHRVYYMPATGNRRRRALVAMAGG